MKSFKQMRPVTHFRDRMNEREEMKFCSFENLND